MKFEIEIKSADAEKKKSVGGSILSFLGLLFFLLLAFAFVASILHLPMR